MLEITGKHIELLSDSHLRELVGLLCEADFRAEELATNVIQWGGDQRAGDGGFDVVVRGDASPAKSNWIPRACTGIQVKAESMNKAKIVKEMRQGRKDTLHDSICECIEKDGAYIIISSKDATTDTMLKDRLAGMNAAVSREDPERRLSLNFYDQGQLATWVRSYPSLAVWVRTRINQPLRGWKGHDNWSGSPEGVDGKYFFNEQARVFDGGSKKGEELSILSGLGRIRSILSQPRRSVRLVGLSGVGKTRLVQALFDDRVGNDSLSRDLPVYTDVNETPEPPPVVLAQQLVDEKLRAVLIVDNCSPSLHGSLTKICASPNSKVSVLTVEYDVQDDLPERTDVFKLEPANEGIIELLINSRYPNIGEVNARTIAEFSGGNARIAIALAGTIDRTETLAVLGSNELFTRLFSQRHEGDAGLIESAQACSLLYSFDGETLDANDSELKILSNLIDTSGLELYKHVAELHERDLVQSRGKWRAVLPHAIANRLASRALKSIPLQRIEAAFLGHSVRLITSFSRRLSYLHDSDEAQAIVNNWLRPEGWIGKSVHNFNKLGLKVFLNIAPVSPDATLEIIEHVLERNDCDQFFSRENPHFVAFTRLLRHLAYETEMFERAVRLLILFAVAENEEENRNSVRNQLRSLFYIKLSGTQASPETRLRVVESLLKDTNETKQRLGIFLYDATIKAWHFSASCDFSFGARSRDFGYIPSNEEDVTTWFRKALELGAGISHMQLDLAAHHYRQ